MLNVLFLFTLEGSPYQLVEHSSEIYKQQKLFDFFGCKTILSPKDAEVASGSNEGMDSKDLEKSKGSSLPLESKVFDRLIQENERIEFGLTKDAKFTTLLDDGTKVEASNSNSAQLLTPTSSRIDYVSVDNGSAGEHANSKHGQASSVNHSTLSDPNFVENYFKVKF